SGLARESSGNHDDVAVCSFFVISSGSGNAGSMYIDAEDGRGFGHVQRFAGGDSFQNVGEHDVRESSVMNPLRGGGPDKPSADYSDLLSHSQVSLFVLLNPLCR